MNKCQPKDTGVTKSATAKGPAQISTEKEGMVVAGVHGIYGIIDGTRAVKRTNAKHHAFAFSPLVVKSATGETAYGLALSGHF